MVPDGHVDYGELGRIVRTAVRFLDDVIDVNRYPLPEIEQMTKGNRKIGLGVMGFADMLLQLGVPYDSDEACHIAGDVMAFIHQEARAASEELARERGVFPSFEGSIYDRPDGARVRNATTTTIAPTGTISIIAGCSSGIEPLFAVSYIRANVLDDDQMIEVHPHFEEVARQRGFYSDDLMKKIADVGSVRHLDGVPADVQKIFATAHDITPEWHIKLQSAFQKHTDNAVSKTVNFVERGHRRRRGAGLPPRLPLGLQGRHHLSGRQPRGAGAQRRPEQEEARPRSGAGGIATTRPSRPQLLTGETQRMETGCGKLFVIMNDDEYGPREVFANMGKAGGCASSNTEALGPAHQPGPQEGRLLPGDRRAAQGHPLPRALRHRSQRHAQLRRRHRQGPRAPLRQRRRRGGHGAPEPQLSLVEVAQGACPDCGGSIEHEGGCVVCRLCGYSKCG